MFGEGTISRTFRLHLIKNAILVYFSSLVVFYVVMQLVYFKIVNSDGSPYTFGLTSDILSRLGTFLVDVTPIAANILTWCHPVVSMVVLGGIAMGVCTSAFRSWRIPSMSMSTFRLTLGISIALILMSTAHLIVGHDDVRAARVLVSYQATLAIIFCWSLQQIVSLLFWSQRVFIGRATLLDLS
jgi:hypothetical protein